MRIKVASYNILHCEDYLKKKIDYDAFARVIKGFDADVIGLNEVRGKGVYDGYDPQARLLSEKTGYDYYFAKAIDVDGKNPYGNAVLTRLPVKSFETIGIPDPTDKKYKDSYETRCVLRMVLENPEITFLITHFGLNPDEQMNAVKTLLPYLEKEKCVLMGDFNTKPQAEILNPIRALMKDTAELSEKELLTFPSDKPNRKIDYIFVSPSVNILSVDVPGIILSDHRAVTAEIEI